MSIDEVRALMNGGSDPRHSAVSRWMRRIEVTWNADATLTLRATLGPVFYFEDGAERPSTPSAVAELRGRPRVTCQHEGHTPDSLIDDPRFEGAFCRSALAATGLPRGVALTE